MTNDILHDIPIEYRDKFRVFLAEDPIETSVLKHQMDQYLETVRLLAPLVKAFSLTTMEQLGQNGLELLATADGDEQRALAQAVVRYLVEEEQDDEITGVLGLDDDVAICNAVCRGFGRHDMLIKSSR